ncbi:MAG TPA: S9 family peptidase [Acidobacteriota bacterium]|nr:S9 family peptidase [Acidobacteriota bacterium]
MKKSLATPLALLTLLLGAAVADALAQPEQPPAFQPLDVFELEYASDPRISPDGSRIVYVRNSFDIMKDRRQGRLWIIEAHGEGHRPLSGGESNESSPRFSPDGSRLAYIASHEGKPQIYLRWLESGQTARLTQLTQPPRNIAFSPDGKWIAFNMLVPSKGPQPPALPNKPEGAEWADPPQRVDRLRHKADGRGHLTDGYQHLFVVPAEGGTPRQLTEGDFNHGGDAVWTPDSRHILFSGNRNPDWEYEFRNSEIYSVSLQGGQIKALTQRNGPDSQPAVSPDGSLIAFTGYDDRVQTYQVTRLYVMDRNGGNRRQLAARLDRSFRDPQWADDGSGLYVLFDDRGNTKLGFVPLDGGDVEVLSGDVGGTSYGRPYPAGSYSLSDQGRYVFTHTRPHHPADLVVGSRGGGQRRITHLNEDLFSQRRLGRVEEIWWESSFDQRRIQGWIVYPPDFDESKKYPLLLEIHGGPIANYGDRFSAEMQLYASAGYVVLYANPRGSTGYGEEFGNLLHHNYPGEDYDDLISGVDAVLARGFVDSERLYVTGGSAGGIMTAWIVGKTDRFRAAVVVKPVINWYSKVLTADNYYAYHEYRYPGSPWENPEAYLKFSPISLVGNVSTPTLLMGGTADMRTPLAEAEQFYHALKLRKIDTALVRIPGASHNISRRPSQLIAKVAYVLDWFEDYR